MGSVNQTFSVIAYNSDGCSYSTDYTVLSGGSGNINGLNSIGYSFISSTLCSDTNTWFYLTNPLSVPPNQPILEIGANDIVTWRIYCEYDNPQQFDYVEEWDRMNMHQICYSFLMEILLLYLDIHFPSSSAMYRTGYPLGKLIQLV